MSDMQKYSDITFEEIKHINEYERNTGWQGTGAGA